MKRLSLQWRITLMSVLLIGITCVAMNLLLCSSGVYYMDTIADSLQGGGTVILNDGGAASFDPQLIAPNEELTIVVDGAQGRFRTTNWYITAAVTLLSGILAYFVSGRALKPLRSFASQVEQVQLNNLADMRIDEDAISEFRQLSRSFNQMLERLNNAFAAQRQFTGNAAHELRTPLALMQAQLELFSAEHTDVLPETAEFLTLLREQTERLTQMTKTLLEMSNLQQVARNERIQLAPMIEEIFTDLVPLSDKLGVTLTAEGDGIMTGSDALIYRLIFNLTENAVKYNRQGGYVRLVCREVEPADGVPVYEYTVADNGIGMSEEFQQHLYEPFCREEQQVEGASSGTGLGAPIAKQLVELMGGTMSFTSVLGQGTTFTIRLPFEKCDRSEIPQAVRVDAGDGDALQGLRVLLVEDNDLNAEIAQFTLSRAGAVVTHAKDGESAVEMFAASAPYEYDVVLMDIMMPGIDGLEATRRIRALDREDAATTPIIAVSANAFADDRRLSREAGMDAHLSKPVSSQELVEALAHIAADAL